MNGNPGWIVGVSVSACLTAVAVTLHFWGAVEVRTDPVALLGLTFVGALWIFLASKIFPWLGLSFEFDIVDCKNTAAVIAFSGAVVAIAILYVCGNFGEGPSYLENFFSAGVGCVAWFLLWLIFELTTKVSLSITEQRDLASGVRCCGILVATGLILGRATAGNWASAFATIHDLFRDGWVAGALLVLALPVESFVQPSKFRPFPSWINCGVVPAIIYLSIAGAWLWHLGRWEGMPQ
jgi:uncharacterized membrane protein YjfL (UPF0719 family)